MIDEFDINTLKKDLHTNLILIEKQIAEYSNKFRNKLYECLKNNIKNLDKLNKINLKIQNNISDDLYIFLQGLNKVLEDKKEKKTIKDEVDNYILNNSLNINKKSISNLDMLEYEIISYLKKMNNANKIFLIKSLFDSYKESLSFTVRSLNKKISQLLDESLEKLDRNSSIMRCDKQLNIALSFFNISYNERENTLFIDDNGNIITLNKIKENTYKINDNINLLLKYEEDLFTIAIEINGAIINTIKVCDNKNNITFISSKKDDKKGINYQINNKLMTILDNDDIKESKIDSLDNLNLDLKNEIMSIAPSFLNLLKAMENEKVQSKKISI